MEKFKIQGSKRLVGNTLSRNESNFSNSPIYVLLEFVANNPANKHHFSLLSEI